MVEVDKRAVGDDGLGGREQDRFALEAGIDLAGDIVGIRQGGQIIDDLPRCSRGGTPSSRRRG